MNRFFVVSEGQKTIRLSVTVSISPMAYIAAEHRSTSIACAGNMLCAAHTSSASAYAAHAHVAAVHSECQNARASLLVVIKI